VGGARIGAVRARISVMIIGAPQCRQMKAGLVSGTVRVLSRLFRRCFLEALTEAHRGGRLQFFGEYAGLADPAAFARWVAPLRVCEWVVYANVPSRDPKRYSRTSPAIHTAWRSPASACSRLMSAA
jgi:hypothetical protein